MRSTALPVVAALMLVPSGAAAQGPWGKVKAWTGSVTIEATDTRPTKAFTWLLTYKATGEFTIADEAMLDGDHMQWPMPDPEGASDPTALAAAYTPWQSRVVAGFESSGVDEEGNRFSRKCTADHPQPARLGVISNPGAEEYLFSVEVPAAVLKCTGTPGPPPQGRISVKDLQLTGPRGAPGPVSGTKTFTEGTKVIKVSFTMKPVK